MEIIQTVSNLYKPDKRWADRLIQPQRFFSRLWHAVLYEPLEAQTSRIYQIALRVFGVGILIFVSLGVYPLGFVGAIAKSFSKIPSDFLARVSVDIPKMEIAEITLKPPVNCRLTRNFLPEEMLKTILNFCSWREKLQLVRVSKEWKQLIGDGEITAHYNLDQKSIFGPLRCRNKDLREDRWAYHYKGIKFQKQLAAYNTISYPTSLEIGYTKYGYGFLDYVARHNLGGPVAFLNFPQIEIFFGQIPSRDSPISCIQPEMMEQPIATILDMEFKRMGIALRIANYATGKKSVLVLVENPKGRWIHAANDYFSENQINLEEQQHLDYIMCLINQEPFPLPVPQGFDSQLQLA